MAAGHRLLARRERRLPWRRHLLPPKGSHVTSFLPLLRCCCVLCSTVPRYTPEHWREVGRATMYALLEVEGINPWSRIPKYVRSNVSFATLKAASNR